MKIGRRSLQILARLIGLFLVTMAVVTFWLPGWLVQTQLPKVSALLGREVSVQKLTLKPWALAVDIEGLRIAAQPGQPGQSRKPDKLPFLQIKHIGLNASIASLRYMSPVIESVLVDEPILNVARTAPGQFDFDDLVANLMKLKSSSPNDDAVQFAVHNILLKSGQLHFDDQPVGRKHVINDVQLALPFASNFDANIKTYVLPHLSGQLNGKAFATQSQALPFANPPQAKIDFNLADMDLVPYIPYLPKSLPLQLTKGRLQAQLQLQFVQANAEMKQAARAELTGHVLASDWALNNHNDELLSWQGLDIKLASLKPFEQKVDLSSVQLNGAQVQLVRNHKGVLNLMTLGGGDSATTTATAKQKNTSQAALGTSANATPNTNKLPGWQVSLGQFKIDKSLIHWRDASVKPTADIRLQELALDVRKLQWPNMQPAPLQLSALIASDKTEPANLSIKGKVTDQEAQLTVSLKDLNLIPLAPYTAQQVPLQLSGQLGLEAELDWSSSTARDKAFALKLVSAGLDNFKAVSTVRDETVTVRSLTLADVLLDMETQQLSLGAVKVQQPVLPLHRLSNGDWTWQAWLSSSASAQTAQTAPTSNAAPTEHQVHKNKSAWRYDIKDIALQDGTLKYQDELDAAKLRKLIKEHHHARWPND